MINKLTNNFLSIEVETLGAELSSLSTAAGDEYLWQRSAGFWQKTSPLLFPIIGRLKDAAYNWQGQSYEMSTHGFASRSNFELINTSENSLQYCLKSSSETKEIYPFDFELLVTYKLQESSLEVEYSVNNTGKGVLPFSIGGHPGFSCNWQKDDCLENYYLHFSEKENAARMQVTPEGLFGREMIPCLQNSDRIDLNEELFDECLTLVFKDLKSKTVSLCHKQLPQKITMNISQFPYFGVWSESGADFVCLEPWLGFGDYDDHDLNFASKAGLIHLGSGEIHNSSFNTVIEL